MNLNKVNINNSIQNIAKDTRTSRKLTKLFTTSVDLVILNTNTKKENIDEVSLCYQIFNLKETIKKLENQIKALAYDNELLAQENTDISNNMIIYKEKYDTYKSYLKNLSKNITSNYYIDYDTVNINSEEYTQNSMLHYDLLNILSHKQNHLETQYNSSFTLSLSTSCSTEDKNNLSYTSYEIDDIIKEEEEEEEVNSNEELKLQSTPIITSESKTTTLSKITNLSISIPNNSIKPQLNIKRYECKEDNEDEELKDEMSLYYDIFKANQTITELESILQNKDEEINLLNNDIYELSQTSDGLMMKIKKIDLEYHEYKSKYKKLINEMYNNNNYHEYDIINSIVNNPKLSFIVYNNDNNNQQQCIINPQFIYSSNILISNIIESKLEFNNYDYVTNIIKPPQLSLNTTKIDLNIAEPTNIIMMIERIDLIVKDINKKLKTKEDIAILFEIFDINSHLRDLENKIEEHENAVNNLTNINEDLNEYNHDLLKKIKKLEEQYNENQRHLSDVSNMLEKI